MGDLLEVEEEIAETSLRREKEKWQLEEKWEELQLRKERDNQLKQFVLAKQEYDDVLEEELDGAIMDEYKKLVERELARGIEHWRDVKEFEPQSEKMKELFEWQAEYKLKKQSRQKGL